MLRSRFRARGALGTLVFGLLSVNQIEDATITAGGAETTVSKISLE